MKRLLLHAGLAAALSTPAIVAPAGDAYAADPMVGLDSTTAVNVAGRQRMLSQRMAKAYLMLGQNIATGDARRILDESIDQFESGLSALSAYQPTPGVKQALAALETAWSQCSAPLAAPPSKAGAYELYEVDETLQRAAHHAVLAYERVTGAPRDHLVNLIGRQRMLSQRMAKFYFYRTWEVYDAPADMELHLSHAHFTAVLNQIEVSALTSAPVRERLARLRREWEPYEELLLASKEPAGMRKDAARVAALSEEVLAGAEELVTLVLSEASGSAN
ncbi:MAG: hypothetical protein NFCOHLIN_00527 [Gammaproteobacteria bacterium]|nr:hypothetical protein [Gammaproteobacteria bacterium]